jgi:hypothetical protein
MISKEDPIDILVWLISQGYAVAARSVYNGTSFHVRAVKGETVLVSEGRELGKVLRNIKVDAGNEVQASSRRIS